ncbi:class I SAM-dependent methyltransferase [Actinoallomurus sp. NPDC052274]|uniref:class I SAM-dependent methyltransferase n=1 Tax=Actinoallomurus sp. NPDC052274 TaxID=3155420 RepID=UPI003432B8B4
MSSDYGTPEDRYSDISAIYDDLYDFTAETEETVSFLAKLASGGRVLELGVGTGRVALPLAERGCDVTGVDASPDMLRMLRTKDPGRKVKALRSDMTAPEVDGEFDVIYAVWNSFCELHTQERQVACVASAARLLRDGGSLVLETSVAHRALTEQRPISVGPFTGLNAATFQLMRYDQLDQIVEYRHVFLNADGVKVMASTHRLVHLTELDLMARLGDLELTARHGDWTGGPFHAASARHVSVYTKTGRAPSC